MQISTALNPKFPSFSVAEKDFGLGASYHRDSTEDTNKITPKSFQEKVVDFSKIIFSRESTYRSFVDLFAEDLPSVIAEAFRNKYKFAEEIFKSITSTGAMFIAPKITKLVSKIIGKNFFPEASEEEISNYLLFSRKNLEDLDSVEEEKSIILERDVKDQEIVAGLFEPGSKRHSEHLKNAREIENFISDIEIDDEKRERINKFKEAVIIGESMVEGSFWGLWPFLIRLFRRYVLGQERFTGTSNYLDEKNSEKLGIKKGMGLKEILGTMFSMSSTTLFNLFTMKNTRKTFKDKPNSVMKTLKDKLDMKHKYYPQSGLYMTFGTIPIYLSKIFNSQGGFELVENLLKGFVTTMSLWFGDRASNGILAKKADQELSKEFGVEGGILYHKHEIDKDTSWWTKLKEAMPEAKRFHEVIEKVHHNSALKKAAIEKYVQSFYKGFTFHSFGTFLLKMGVNMITKFRVDSALKKV